MKIECTYYDQAYYGYTCTVEKQKIPADTKLEFIGTHENGRTDNDVKYIRFNECVITKVPQGLTEKFPNLDGIEIYDAGLKDINRVQLFEYKNFKWYYFGFNKIEYLPGDLFADCKNLTEIGFGGNFLAIVEPNILDGLEHLKLVNLEGKSINYGSINSQCEMEKSDPRLLELKNKLSEEYIKKLRRDNQKLSSINTFIQTDEELKDFHINIGNKQFHVHKIFLAARSPTLAEILRNNPDAEHLNLVDISVDTFEHVLKFLYSDEYPLETNLMDLFAAAEYLKIGALKEYASKKILERLNNDNSLEVLSLANKYKHHEMKRASFEIIKQKYPKIEFEEELLNEDDKIDKMVEHLQKIRKIEKELEDSIKNNN